MHPALVPASAHSREPNNRQPHRQSHSYGQAKRRKKVEKDIPSDVETSSSSSRCSCTSCNAELVEEDSEDITETQRYSIEGKRAEKASITGRGVDGKPVANLVAEERDLEVGVAEPSQEPSPGELHRLEHLRHWPDATEEITF